VRETQERVRGLELGFWVYSAGRAALVDRSKALVGCVQVEGAAHSSKMPRLACR
jgi:hypothetical protein